MSFFRSEAMSLCQMILHTESAFNCLILLGYEGKVQFRNIYDGNPVVNDLFTSEVKRCQELKRFISHLQQLTNECNIKTVIYPDIENEIPEANDLKTIETIVQQIYYGVVQITSSVELLRGERVQLLEKLHVVEKADIFFDAKTQNGYETMSWSDSVMKMLIKNELHAEFKEGIHLSFFTGTIPTEKYYVFERLLWRVTKGNFYMKYEEYFPACTEKEKKFPKAINGNKGVFMIFFFGHELRKKIAKLCQGFGIKLFECSESQKERQTEVESLKKKISELDIVLERTEEYRYNLLLKASGDLNIWRAKINKMLMVYYVLNRMSRIRNLEVNKYLRVECWIPTNEIAAVRAALLSGARRTAKDYFPAAFLPMVNEIHRHDLTDLDKPTFFAVNKFTKGFQNLIDSYGIAQYQELNPAPFTIITFPFLFAVMFGDVGHGFILFLFGICLVWKEKYFEGRQRFIAERNEIFDILFTGRYIISLMGAFSIYTGLIYNECFSKGFNLFGSAWRPVFNRTHLNRSGEVRLDPNNPEHYRGVPYVLGMDPVWKAAGENAIVTVNSLKMKLAIILGVTQMVFGLILSAFNLFHKREYVNLLLVWLPQVTFMLCIFGYLVFLIFYKWMEYGGHKETPYNTACAPSILIVFINMLMMKGTETPPAGCEAYMFNMQPFFQMGLLFLALLSVPVLLAGKPIYFTIQEKKIQKIKNEQLKDLRRRVTVKSIRESLLYNVETCLHAMKLPLLRGKAHNEEAVLSELWIHSGIHCIESVLGSISHTASYLRLWALSLAHEELSTILWNMVLRVGLNGRHGYWNSVMLYMIFIAWSLLTITILVVMEGLSAFLHTLRLHWVEFQSKFYDGSGESFQPFRFKMSS